MSAARPSRSLRALRIAVVSLLGIVFGWLLLANLALWTGLVERAVTGDRERSSIRLQHGFAWCVWPTKVHFSDLELAIDTHKWQLELRIPDGELDVNLWELPFKRFHASSIEGHAVEAAFRIKLDPARDDLARVESYAPSQRLGDPVLEGEPPAEALPEDAWVVALDSIDIDVDRVWVNDVRADVRAGVSAGFYTLAGHVLTVYPTYVDIEEGTIAVRGEPALEGMVGSLRLQLLDYSPQHLQGKAILRQLFADVSLAGDVPNLQWLRASMKDGPVTLGEGAGRLELDVGLAAGTLLPDSRVQYETASLHADVRASKTEGEGEFRVRTAARLVGEVHGRDAGPLTTVRVVLRDLTAEPAGAEAKRDASWLKMPRLTGEVGFARADLLAERWPVSQAELDVPSIEVRDLGALERVGDLRVRSGKLRGSVQGRTYESGRIGGSVEIDARDLEVVTAEGIPLRGNVELQTSLWTKRGFETLAGEITGGKLERLVVGKDPDGVQTWLRLDEGRFAWRRKAKRIEFSGAGAVEDLRAVLAQKVDRKAWVELVPGRGLLTPLEFEFEANIATGRKTPRVDIEVKELRRPSLSITGRFVKEGERTRAALVFERARLGFVKDGGAWSVAGGVTRAWLEERWAWVGAL